MIEARLFYQDGTLTGIECKGHSGYSHSGTDIICAAVSALMQAMMLGLEGITRNTIDERVPLMRVMWPVNEQEKISLLTNTIAGSLTQIAKDNPAYVKVMEVRK